MRKAVIPISLALGACSTMANETPPATSGGKCQADKLSEFVGREATSEVGAELLRQSGARDLRWAAKGGMLTMDFREDRLTVFLDAGNKIERFDCV